jgi:hypothetical protein
VLDLASRYGFGDWSEEEDENDEEAEDRQEHEHEGSVVFRRRQRRKRATSSRPSRTRQQNNSKKSRSMLGVEFDFGSRTDAGLRSSSHDRTRGAGMPSSSPARQSNSPPTQTSRFEQRTEGSRLRPSSITARRAEPVRPAMERANDTRQQTIPARGRGAPIRPAMERVNEVKRRRHNVLDNDD